MRRVKRFAFGAFALLVVYASVVLILEREEPGTVVVYSLLNVIAVISMMALTVFPFHRMFTISNTKQGIATIGSGSIKRLIYRTLDKKSVKSLECEIKKIHPDAMEIRVIAGISTTTNAIDFVEEVQNEVKKAVEEDTGLEVFKVDVHVWHYRGKK